jgi:hypothetical protein
MSIETKELSVTEQIAADAIAAHNAKYAAPVEPVPVTPSDYQKLYEAKVAENETLTAVIAASRVAANTPQNKGSVKAVITCERLRAMVGDLAYNQMPRASKIVALGGDPNTSDETLKKLFGRGNDGKLAADLQRSDPRSYATLREVALGLNLYAK